MVRKTGGVAQWKSSCLACIRPGIQSPSCWEREEECVLGSERYSVQVFDSRRAVSEPWETVEWRNRVEGRLPRKSQRRGHLWTVFAFLIIPCLRNYTVQDWTRRLNLARYGGEMSSLSSRHLSHKDLLSYTYPISVMRSVNLFRIPNKITLSLILLGLRLNPGWEFPRA